MKHPVRAMALSMSALLAASALSAQTNVGFTNPPGYDTISGGYYGYIFSDVMDGRTQYGEGGPAFSATTALIQRINYRTTTNRAYSAAIGTGRKWTNLVVSLGPGSVTKMGNTYTQNFIRPPTVVYSAAFSMPTQTVSSPTQAWGNTASIAFSTPYVKLKGEDLIHDYQWVGGKLDNGLVVPAAIYMHDAVKVPSFNSSGFTRLPTSATCNDSAFSHASGAYLHSTAAAFPSTYSVPSYQNKTLVAHYSYYTAPGQGVIHAASVGGSDQGIAVPGWGCNLLYLNGSFLLGLESHTADVANGYVSQKNKFLNFNQAWVGTPIYMQAAWTDSKTGQPKLTQATTWQMPAMPSATSADRRAIYGYVSGGSFRGPYGPYPPSSFDYLFPLPRFEVR